ncbi:DegT/DnrJ/EryC1/StrS family aminotransferase [Arenibaculum pallidiluteum]|uniref:DegT/DnrJ/EryC1/StrS family aminotransferase n=1 Tax=Arenibaculum pallidiluteum TaxID=2812559 RepID=UPI001A96BD82|nr:DegT/DnrJ/EryC1/StrS family aminotransferase [Arenibaculum pallidiluteum]
MPDTDDRTHAPLIPAPPIPAPSIPMSLPQLGEEEAAAARRAILSGWVTQGPEVAAFEREFAAFVGAPHACAVSSCTTALHLALAALGVGPGSEVVTVSSSFIATANAVRYVGAIPVFADVEADSGNIDPDQVARAIGPRTRAILVVHQIGLPCNLDRILAIAAERGVPVIEDAACAIGSEILRDGEWVRIGRPLGHVACFSFHPRKMLTTGDGGMLTTADPELDRRFRLLRQHGMSVNDLARHGSREVVFESYDEVGYNYRMTDIQAAIGRVQLARLPDFLALRREQAACYADLLAGIPGLDLPREPSWARTNWQSYCVRLSGGQDQRRVMQALLDRGISTRRGVMCAHLEPAWPSGTWRCTGHYGCGCSEERACAALAQSVAWRDQGLMLPIHHRLSADDQRRVAAALREVLAPTMETA